MKSEKISFKSLTDELIRDKRVNNVERCVIFFRCLHMLEMIYMKTTLTNLKIIAEMNLKNSL